MAKSTLPLQSRNRPIGAFTAWTASVSAGSVAAVAALYAGLSLAAVLLLGPVAWMIVSAFKTSSEILRLPPTFLPVQPTLQAFAIVLSDFAYGQHLLNSVVATVSITACVLVTSVLAGYVFAKYRFFGKEQLFVVLLSTMMIPFAVVLLPLFVFVSQLGWRNTYIGLIVPVSISTFGIFLMRQFIEGVPSELIDAARIDGASELWIVRRVIVPLSLSALSALGIFTFMWHWDSYLWPLAIISEREMQTLPLFLAGLQWEHQTRYDVTMAASVLTVLPIVVIYAMAQRQFIRGIALTGLKA